MRVRSASSVKSEILPPNIVCKLAPTVPQTDRDRTTTPRTTPRLSTIRNPGTSKPVVVMLDGMSAVCEWMMEDMSHVSRLVVRLSCKRQECRPDSQVLRTILLKLAAHTSTG